MTYQIIAILILATWRLSYMITDESGPWGVFIRLRAKCGYVPSFDDNGKLLPPPDGTLAEWVTCTGCMSMAVGPVLFLISLTWIGWWVCAWLALGACAIIVNNKLIF